MALGRRLVAALDRLSALASTAAEMAFYFALSFVPFLALTAVAAVSWLPAEVGEPLAGALAGVLPPEAGLDPAALAAWVGSARRSGWLAAGVVLAAWSSYRFMRAAVRALATVGGADASDWRHRLRAVASALALMVLWMAALLATAFVLLAAPGLEETLTGLPRVGDAVAAADLARLLAAAVLLAALLATYRAIPDLGARGARLWLGALLATAGWIGVAEVVRRALPALWGSQSLYGALGSFVLFLLWCWANAWVVLACGALAGRRRRRPAATATS